MFSQRLDQNKAIEIKIGKDKSNIPTEERKKPTNKINILNKENASLRNIRELHDKLAKNTLTF